MPQKPKYSISERQLFLRIFDIVTIVVSILIFSKYAGFHYFRALESNLIVWLLTLCSYILFFGQIFELYNLKVSSSRYLVLRSIGITALLVTVFYIFTPIISPELPENRLQILYLFAVVFAPLTIWRFLYIGLITLPKYHKYILLIGDEVELSNLIPLIKQKAPDNNIIGYVSNNKIQDLDDYNFFDVSKNKIRDIVSKHFVSEVVVLKSKISTSKNVHSQLIHLFENGVPILSARKYIEDITRFVPEMDLKDPFYDYLTFSKSHQSNLYIVFIRLFDIVVSLIGVLFLTILLPLILIGNLIGNRGSLFYFQDRVGKKGEVFNIIKLRTMVKDAEKNGAVWAEKNDTRITTFGKFLRRTRFDEIPQFLNILRSDMSLIGPRPERPEFVSQLEEKLPFYAIRHVVKPGLTGWAQVMYPYANTIEEQNEKLRYDLYYIKERNLLLDLRIVIKTITTVLYFKGQ
ncbi:MAG: exopolysaccharide biosynthesis polyprenyl glycosylphosphotransferase [Flavobacteriaceae bacterium]|nr:exopolysaccharide biosynthesis polyprenyl glycosylphosphotransferase [Flavobacteriaceae bacterium]